MQPWSVAVGKVFFPELFFFDNTKSNKRLLIALFLLVWDLHQCSRRQASPAIIGPILHCIHTYNARVQQWMNKESMHIVCALNQINNTGPTQALQLSEEKWIAFWLLHRFALAAGRVGRSDGRSSQPLSPPGRPDLFRSFRWICYRGNPSAMLWSG